jgi:pimeloyl-ACP methyl ester carboxylesterase
MRQFAGDAVALLDILGIDRVAVVGHSMGGMVAQEIALDHSDRLWALVLAETSYGIRSTWLEALLTNLTVPLLRYYSVERQADLYARALGRYTPAVERYVRREIGILADEAGGGSENVWAIWQAVMRFASKDRLSQIRVPTLVLVGERFRQTHGQGQTMARLVPGAKFGLIEDAGHMLNWDNAGQFNAEVLSFLAETCGQALPSVL